MHLELEEEHLYFTRESLKISMSGKDILLSATLTLMLLCHALLQSRTYTTLGAQAEGPSGRRLLCFAQIVTY